MLPLGIRSRVVVALIAAVVAGSAVALLKGQADGLRDALGNLSAPWLLVAFWCGSFVRSRTVGAVLGAAATGFALAGFCIGLAIISDYGVASAGASVQLAFDANTRYFEAGLISGPLLGAFGATCQRHAVNRILVAGAVLLAEPVTMVAARRFSMLSSVTGGWSGSRSTAYLIEGVFGALVVVAALLHRPRLAPTAH